MRWIGLPRPGYARFVSFDEFNVSGLPSGTSYVGAWINSAGHLVLHRNDGKVYEIDISGPTILSTTTERNFTRNDAAVCVQ